MYVLFVIYCVAVIASVLVDTTKTLKGVTKRNEHGEYEMFSEVAEEYSSVFSKRTINAAIKFSIAVVVVFGILTCLPVFFILAGRLTGAKIALTVVVILYVMILAVSGKSSEAKVMELIKTILYIIVVYVIPVYVIMPHI